MAEGISDGVRVVESGRFVHVPACMAILVDWPYLNSSRGSLDLHLSKASLIVDAECARRLRFKAINRPTKFSETPATIRSLAPELGQHTEEILLELGYTWDDLAKLKNEGAIL